PPVRATKGAKRSRVAAWVVAGVAGVGLVTAGIAGVAKRGGTVTSPTASGSSGEAPKECTKRSECTKKLGQPAVCNAGKCAALASEDCVVKADPVALESDDTVWFGTMFPRGDSDFDAELRAVDLARLDFVQM